jgi:predicted PurR-regulated permease PerM
MFDELKKDLSSFKLLIMLATIAVSIYLFQYFIELVRNFSDILLIIFFGWLVSFILEPFVDMFTNYLKIPRIASTVIVFVLAAIIISLAFIVFIPDMAIQIKTLQKLIPTFLETAPPVVQSGVDNFIKSLSNYEK